MAYLSCIKLWESEFGNIVFKKDKLQDLNFNQLKLQVQDTYEKDEKPLTNFEPINKKDIIKKGLSRRKIIKNKRPLINIGKRLQRI